MHTSHEESCERWSPLFKDALLPLHALNLLALSVTNASENRLSRFDLSIMNVGVSICCPPIQPAYSIYKMRQIVSYFRPEYGAFNGFVAGGQ